MEGKVKIDINNFTQCNILCPIHFSYKDISIVYQSDYQGKKFIVKTDNDSNSYVSFKKISYQLKDIRIIPQTHEINNDEDVLGECLLIHEQNGNHNNKLLVYIPLEKSVSKSLSQNFFSNLDSSDELRNGSMDIELNDESLLDLIPNRRKFFWYVSNEISESQNKGNNTYIVFNDSIPIYANTFNSLSKDAKDYYKSTIEIIKLYGNDGSTLTIEGVEKAGVQVKCKKVTKTKDINLDKKCDDDSDDDDSDDDDTDKKNEFSVRDAITAFEGRILVFLTGFIGLFFIICLFKISERGFGMENLKLILKLIGFLIWIPIQVSYIYVARFITNSIVFIFWCLGKLSNFLTSILPLRYVLKNGPSPGDEFLSGTMNCITSATFNGLNCNRTSNLNFIIAILTLFYYYTLFSGSIRTSNRINKNKTKLCLNKVRTLGPGIPIDRCVQELNLTQFIKGITFINGKKEFSIFLFIRYFNEYLDNGGYSYKECLKYVAFKLDKRFTKLRNYIVNIELKDGMKYKCEYKFCDLFNYLIENNESDLRQLYKKKKCITVVFDDTFDNSSDTPSRIDYDDSENSENNTSEIIISTTPVDQCDDNESDYHFRVENTDKFDNSLLIVEISYRSKIDNYYTEAGKTPSYADLNSTGTTIPLIRFTRFCMNQSVSGYIFKEDGKEYIMLKSQNDSSKFDMETMTGYYKIEEIADYIENDYYGIPFYISKNRNYSGGYPSNEIIAKDSNNINITNLVEKLKLGGRYGNRLNNYYDKTTFNEVLTINDRYMGPIIEIKLSNTKSSEADKSYKGLLYCNEDKTKLYFMPFKNINFDDNDNTDEPFFIVDVHFNNIYLLAGNKLKILKNNVNTSIDELDLESDFEEIGVHKNYFYNIINKKEDGIDLLNNKLPFKSERRTISDTNTVNNNNMNNSSFLVSLRLNDEHKGSDRSKIIRNLIEYYKDPTYSNMFGNFFNRQNNTST